MAKVKPKGMYGSFVVQAEEHGVDAAFDQWAQDLGDEKADQLRQRYLLEVANTRELSPPVVEPAGFEGWYAGPQLDDSCWPAFREFLLVEKERVEEQVNSIDNDSNAVVGHTANPKLPEWKSRGLVVGYVQSGKTTNFVAVANKLADQGYGFIIVLSGMHNSLRKQTQERLDEQLGDLVQDKWDRLTDVTRDFQTPPGLPGQKIGHRGKTVYCVVKKNKAVLNKLYKWLDNPSFKPKLKEIKVAIIDDEADQASVATASINPLITDILELFPKSTYIGYTATPFANVFIDPLAQKDLYPKDFILNLERPGAYFGPEKIFGLPGVGVDHPDFDGYDMVREVDLKELPLLRPEKRADIPDFEPIVNGSVLGEAIRWFFLATAARRVRDDHDHSSMLIHTHLNTQVHESYKGPVREYRDRMLRDLEKGDGDLLRELEQQWEREVGRVPAGSMGLGLKPVVFAELVPHLRQIVEKTKVIIDNSRSKDRLVYKKDETVYAIAIGANTLSRGLTLEGLLCSVFVRTATAYDTLLQMGRWFGFRIGYEDLPRIWMTEELRENFQHLAWVEQEMRQEIDLLQKQSVTPMEVAVRIRTHPNLRITQKMGAAVPSEHSFAGRRLTTRYFRVNDTDWLSNNLEAAERLVNYAASKGEHKKTPEADVFLGVPVLAVIRFLEEYSVHSESLEMDTLLMLKYINKVVRESEFGELEKWNVAVIQGSSAESVDFGGLHGLRTSIRSRLNKSSDDKADIKTLMNPGDIAIDRDIPRKKAKAAKETDLLAARQTDPQVSGRGLLVLYPIEKESAPTTEKSKQARKPLNADFTPVGLAVVFPGALPGSPRTTVTHMSVISPGIDHEIEEEMLQDINEDTEGDE